MWVMLLALPSESPREPCCPLLLLCSALLCSALLLPALICLACSFENYSEATLLYPAAALHCSALLSLVLF